MTVYVGAEYIIGCLLIVAQETEQKTTTIQAAKECGRLTQERFLEKGMDSVFIATHNATENALYLFATYFTVDKETGEISLSNGICKADLCDRFLGRLPLNIINTIYDVAFEMSKK